MSKDQISPDPHNIDQLLYQLTKGKGVQTKMQAVCESGKLTTSDERIVKALLEIKIYSARFMPELSKAADVALQSPAHQNLLSEHPQWEAGVSSQFGGLEKTGKTIGVVLVGLAIPVIALLVFPRNVYALVISIVLAAGLVLWIFRLPQPAFTAAAPSIMPPASTTAPSAPPRHIVILVNGTLADAWLAVMLLKIKNVGEGAFIGIGALFGSLDDRLCFNEKGEKSVPLTELTGRWLFAIPEDAYARYKDDLSGCILVDGRNNNTSPNISYEDYMSEKSITKVNDILKSEQLTPPEP